MNSQLSVQLVSVRDGCLGPECKGRHALVFVHGIYGGSETFTNTQASPAFSWPENVPARLAGRDIDVFRLEYQTTLLTWASSNNAPLENIIRAVEPQMKTLRSKYDSVNFVAHSLGGNIVTAYIHSVKSLWGHAERAKHGFTLALGTPVDGASIANVGLLLKDMLGMRDPLLRSLERDSPLLRMMSLWADQENEKAERLRCRPVRLYAGIESKPLGPIQVVSKESALAALGRCASTKVFPLNHSEICKPRSSTDEVFLWFMEIAEKEIERINKWTSPLCMSL